MYKEPLGLTALAFLGAAAVIGTIELIVHVSSK